MTYELIVQNNDKIYSPSVLGGVTWTTERKGTPGELKFTYLADSTAKIREGNPIRLKVDGKNVFYGFVFSKKSNKNKQIEVRAYDQLRYLKNKDVYVYDNLTAAEVVKMIALDFNLNLGTIDKTAYKIPSRVEDNVTLFDIINNALDLELENKKNMFVLYDNFGMLSLTNIANMKLPLVIDVETGQNYDYSSSIDESTYNKIKLVFDNEETGARDVYIAKDSSHINEWGMLQYFDKLKKGENGQSKVNALLSLYNSKTRNLKISGCFGDVRVRAGTMPICQLTLDDVTLSQYMLVERAQHTFNENEHMMDITVRGGEFVA